MQFVFAVSKRQCLIPREHKSRLHEYIGGLLLHRKQKPLAIHCMPEHAHIFIGYNPTVSVPDLIKEIKVESNQFVNQQRWTGFKFSWQEGYGGFSYSRSQIDNVIKYVNNQEIHHAARNFRQEYLALLKEFDIAFEEKYLFEFFD